MQRALFHLRIKYFNILPNASYSLKKNGRQYLQASDGAVNNHLRNGANTRRPDSTTVHFRLSLDRLEDIARPAQAEALLVGMKAISRGSVREKDLRNSCRANRG